MAKRKEDIKYGTAQAKVAVDGTLRVAYKHGTPREGGRKAESKRVDLFSSAPNISPAQPQLQPRPSAALPPPPATADDDSNTPKNSPATSTSAGLIAPCPLFSLLSFLSSLVYSAPVRVFT